MAGGGRSDALCASRHQGGVRDRRAGRLSRRNGQGRHRAAHARCEGGGNHRLGAQPHGGLQGAARRAVRRPATENRHRQNPLARTSGARARQMKMVTVTLFLLKKIGTVPIFLLAVLFSTAAQAQITVQDAWARATPPGAKIAAGYLVIRNAGGADRLLGASSPAAERVETHTTMRHGDISRMRQVKGYAV